MLCAMVDTYSRRAQNNLQKIAKKQLQRRGTFVINTLAPGTRGTPHEDRL
jgi:hypothetical protein